MNCKYGCFPDSQMTELKTQMRKKIFYLLLCADENFEDEDFKSRNSNVNIPDAIEELLIEFYGLNELLSYPPELIRIMSILVSAKDECLKDNFNFKRYRKLILSAGAEVLKIKGV